MATTNVSLPEKMKNRAEAQIRDERYGDASGYGRDPIRKDQERGEAFALLQAAITEGVESGEALPFDVAAFKHRMRKRHVAR